MFAQVKIGLKKILSQEEFFFYKRDILRKHPQQAKKMVQSLKNTILQIFSPDLSNMDNIY